MDHIGAKKVDNGYAVFDGVETRVSASPPTTFAVQSAYRFIT